MIESCTCEGGIQNTGTPNCLPKFFQTTGILLVNLFDDDGVRNSIDLTAAFGKTELDALVNQADKSKRVYPVTGLVSVSKPVADVTWYTDDSEGKTFIRDGLRSFMAEKLAVSPQFVGKLNQNKCQEMGVYEIDLNGSIQGISEDGTKLYPKPITAYTAVYYDFDNTVPKPAYMSLMFDYDRTLFQTAQLWMISGSSIGYNANGLRGLIDVNFKVVGTPSTTGFVADLYLDYQSDSGAPVGFTGAVAADFSANNDTDASPITITGAAESGVVAARYTYTWSAQGAGEKVTVSVDKTGFEGEIQITIPV